MKGVWSLMLTKYTHLHHVLTFDTHPSYQWWPDTLSIKNSVTALILRRKQHICWQPVRPVKALSCGISGGLFWKGPDRLIIRISGYRCVLLLLFLHSLTQLLLCGCREIHLCPWSWHPAATVPLQIPKQRKAITTSTKGITHREGVV